MLHLKLKTNKKMNNFMRNNHFYKNRLNLFCKEKHKIKLKPIKVSLKQQVE